MLLFKKRRIKKQVIDTEVPKIIVGTGIGAAESYYRLKDNIIYSADNGKNKVFQFESAVSGEGKSTIAANTAVALAKSGKKVVVVDLDFRRPKVHKIFEMSNRNGITEYMLGECDESELIKTTEYGVDILNRGKAAHNASIIFTSDKFRALIQKLRETYDMILFDCPPVLLVSDYMHFSDLSDMIIFVVSAGHTFKSQLKEAYELMSRSNPNILGAVMTYRNSSKLSMGYGGYYHSKYYRYLKHHYHQED